MSNDPRSRAAGSGTLLAIGIYLLITYALLVYSTLEGGGGHSISLAYVVFFVLSVPASFLALLIWELGIDLSPYFLPALNALLLYLILRLVRRIRGATDRAAPS